ncbi:hypothetical protein ABFS82_09G052400 [Erythranthe guttata]|uniref:cysteine proteinase inhibitor 4-like n=1 Tax=Erythranthe guttata TaxID=4155 RepID=UPI00064D9FEE|nr:PREDICTED: cysteine proteinase inhibitor 4-like [Erythranthe guttata]|eukprot:XP_012827659.1 PREDICTED: cysteine proteinase inhibitor 4-like [Erythranthe guttata]
MAPISCLVLIAFLLILVETSAAAGVSVWPIWDLKGTIVVLVAKFAVAQHNKEANTTLLFVNVVDGTYVVMKEKCTYRFRLVISAKDNSIAHPKNYSASVFYRPILKNNSMELSHFLMDDGKF